LAQKQLNNELKFIFPFSQERKRSDIKTYYFTQIKEEEKEIKGEFLKNNYKKLIFKKDNLNYVTIV